VRERFPNPGELLEDEVLELPVCGLIHIFNILVEYRGCQGTNFRAHLTGETS
jgi:hypothetical protein